MMTEAQRKQSVRLELAIEGNIASGTLTIGGLGGSFYTFKDGKVSGNRVQVASCNGLTWTVEVVDENSFTIVRNLDLPAFTDNVIDLIPAGPGQPASPGQDSTRNNSMTPIATVTPEVTRGSIRGLVQDQTRALIPGAMVTATSETGGQFTTTTDSVGVYRFPALASGTYTITVSLAGFETATIGNLRLENRELQQDFILRLSALLQLGNPPPASCSPDALLWCSVLHRTK